MENSERKQESAASKVWTPKDARRVLAAWKRSGLSIRAYAKREGLHAWRLYWWQQRLTKPDGDRAGAKPEQASSRFVPVVVRQRPSRSAPASSSSKVLIQRGATTMEIESAEVSPAWVVAVMTGLERT